MSLPLTATADSSVDALVRAAQQGDAGAFASLYDAHVGKLMALCLGLSGDRSSAEELVQDTFVRAWSGLRGFRGESSFSSWLHRIAVNTLRQSERSRRRRSLRVVHQAELGAVADGDGRAEPDAAVAPTDVALSMDLETAMLKLPDGARSVFVLHDIAGYAHAEIALQLGIAEGTSKAHLFRARRLLRGMLDR